MSDNTHEAPLDAPTCSPSSTPETDAAWLAYDRRAAGLHYVSEQMRKLERERDDACKILDDIDDIFHAMRPRWHQTPSMCGRYPCWIVWLPKEGTCERKTLKEAVLEFAAQTLILQEND